jgi:hypothetical protein
MWSAKDGEDDACVRNSDNLTFPAKTTLDSGKQQFPGS